MNKSGSFAILSIKFFHATQIVFLPYLRPLSFEVCIKGAHLQIDLINVVSQALSGRQLIKQLM